MKDPSDLEQSSFPSSLDNPYPYTVIDILQVLHLELVVVPNRPDLKHCVSPRTKLLLSLIHDHHTEGPVPKSLRGGPESPADPTRRRVSFARLGSSLISEEPPADVEKPSWFDGDEFGLAGDSTPGSSNEFMEPSHSFPSTTSSRSALDGRYGASGHRNTARSSQYADIERLQLLTTPPLSSLKNIRRLPDPFPKPMIASIGEIPLLLLLGSSSRIQPVIEGVVSSIVVALA